MAKIFISHSSRDKRTIVQALVDELHRHDHDVWYDSESLQLGDSVALGISEGLSRSQHYLLAISSSFLSSGWCLRELGAIVAESIGHSKKLLIIRIDNAPIPSLVSDILRVEVNSGVDEQLRSAVHRVVGFLDGSETSELIDTPRPRAADIVTLLLSADRSGQYGEHLLPRESTAGLITPENEGLILIKPGGTFFEPCLRELFKRITGRCRVRQVRIYDGGLVRRRRLFDTQYVTSTRIACGEVALSSDDMQRVHEIYDTPEFESEFGVPFSEEFVVPALNLCDEPCRLDAITISAMWEKGRTGGLFHNGKWNGLNKIGYQKSVFPIKLPNLPPPNVRIVLNGFIPGYKYLFTNPDARVIAIHVSSVERWQSIRDSLVGGDSDPRACAEGSIRKDAAKGIIPLNPIDRAVNGQRNVCHSSATLFDGMRELMSWFDYSPEGTLLGQLLSLNEVQREQIEKMTQSALPDISWFTRSETVGQILFEVGLRVARDEIFAAHTTRKTRETHYAAELTERRELIREHRGFRQWIDNGVRLAIGREDVFLRSTAKLFEDSRGCSTFYEVAKTIKGIAAQHPGGVEPETLAEAYRIAAGDVALLQCPAYESGIDSPELFRSLAVGQLPEEAMNCAHRTRKNLLNEFQATYSHGPTRGASASIGESSAWTHFMEQELNPVTPSKPLVALILGGGRSTRMGSTIPKPVLPLRRTLLMNSIRESIDHATNERAEVFAAVGFRSALVRRALGSRVRYLDFEKTLGLAFRVATCLETLAIHEGPVILAYTDMPSVSPRAIRLLIERVQGQRTFGLLVAHGEQLSGHVAEEGGKIVGITQKRLDPGKILPRQAKDVGVYAFFNTTEFRTALRQIRANNVRGEYIFADVVQILAREGWDIVSVEEEPDRAQGINTAGELLSVACAANRTGVGEAELGEMYNTLSADYLLKHLRLRDVFSFRDSLRTYSGPLHFFRWWEEHWARPLV